MGGRPRGPHSQDTLSIELHYFQFCILAPALSPHPTLCPETLCFSSPENKPLGAGKGLCRVKKRIWVSSCFSANSVFSLSPPSSPEVTVRANSRALGGTEDGRFHGLNVTVPDFPHCRFWIRLFLRSTKLFTTHPVACQLSKVCCCCVFSSSSSSHLCAFRPLCIISGRREK